MNQVCQTCGVTITSNFHVCPGGGEHEKGAGQPPFLADTSVLSMMAEPYRKIDALETALVALNGELTRLKGYFEEMLIHPEDVSYGADFWKKLAREALRIEDDF